MNKMTKRINQAGHSTYSDFKKWRSTEKLTSSSLLDGSRRRDDPGRIAQVTEAREQVVRVMRG